MARTITVREGERLDLMVTTDSDAVSATIFLRDTEGIVYEVGPVLFVDKVANFQDEEDISDLPIGTYEVQLNENYATGLPDKWPDSANCRGSECKFLTIKICDAIDIEGESS